MNPRLRSHHLPVSLRAELLPALEILVERHRPEGLWLFASWARGTATRRSDVDLLVMGLADRRLLDQHGDAPFWRTVKAEAIPLLEGRRFL